MDIRKAIKAGTGEEVSQLHDLDRILQDWLGEVYRSQHGRPAWDPRPLTGDTAGVYYVLDTYKIGMSMHRQIRVKDQPHKLALVTWSYGQRRYDQLHRTRVGR
jgi:hypothetical protein